MANGPDTSLPPDQPEQSDAAPTERRVVNIQGGDITIEGSVTGTGIAIGHGATSIVTIHQQVVHTEPRLRVDQDIVENAYLDWLIQCHSLVHLPPVGERLPLIPLEQVFVALRGDASNPFERAQNRKVLQQMVQELESQLVENEIGFDLHAQLRSRILARAPLALTIEERDLPREYQTDLLPAVTLSEIFTREPRLVCLGDPGTGKTTLIRWLALKMAQARRNDLPEVEIAARELDLYAAEDAPLLKLGSPRLPIVVRVARFAEARRRQPSLLLAEFLGDTTWIDDHPTYNDETEALRGQRVASDDLNDLLLSALKAGNALVLLDGLDEIAELQDRDEVIWAIDRFIQDWIPEGLTVALGRDLGEPVLQLATAPPYGAGGNQIIITSRIAGYFYTELRSHLAHFTIEPMGDQAIKRFCAVITRALFEQQSTLSIGERYARAEAESETLLASIHDPQRRGIRELASNPLLLTILALIHHNSTTQLPSQRVDLFQVAIENLARVWRARDVNLTYGQVLEVMGEIADHIHNTNSAGLIEEPELEARLSRYFATLRLPQTSPLIVRDEVHHFLRILNNDVGLLAARGAYIYGFLHLTFQEYLAAHHMVATPERTINLLLQRVGSPRWREPILMALGYMSRQWAANDFERILTALLDLDQAVVILPRSALLIVAALPEMARLPPRIVLALVRQFLHAYSDQHRLGQLSTLREQIEEAMAALRQDERIHLVDQALRAAIVKPSPEHPEERFAAAAIIAHHSWYSEDSVEVLYQALPNDVESWGWPINTLLRQLATTRATSTPPKAMEILKVWQDTGSWLSSAELAALATVKLVQREDPVLPAYQLASITRPRPRLRAELEENPDLVEFIVQEPGWLSLIIALYGGIGDYQAPMVRQEFVTALTAFDGAISTEVREKLAYLLDTTIGPQFDRIRSQTPRFNPKLIYRDSVIDDVILTALRQRNNRSVLIAHLRELQQAHNSEERRAEALVALIALGEEVGKIGNFPIAMARLEQIRLSLTDPLLRLERSLFKLFEELPSGLDTHWGDGLLAIIDLVVANGGDGFNSIMIIDKFISTEQPRLLAENWAFWFTTPNDDTVYNIAVILDTLGKRLTTPPILLAKILAALHRTKRTWWTENGSGTVNWTVFDPLNDEDTIIAAFQTIRAIPRDFSFMRGWALIALGRLLPQHPNLRLEAALLALTVLDKDEYDTYTIALRIIAPNLLVELDPLGIIEKQANQIADLYHRCRILCFLSTHRRQNRHALLKSALAAAKEIRHPIRRFVAYDLLIQAYSEQREALVVEALKLIRGFGFDSVQRAHAYSRLILICGADERGQVLQKLIASLKRIGDERLRASTIAPLLKHLAVIPDALHDLEMCVDRMRQSTNRAIARGQFAPLITPILTLLHQYGQKDREFLAILALAARIHDASYVNRDGREHNLWVALLSSRRIATRNELLTLGAQTHLALSVGASLVLDTLLYQGDFESFKLLLPAVVSFDDSTIPLVERWLHLSDQECAARAALLLAEMDQLNPLIVSYLVKLLSDDEDRLRYRAALVLHGRMGTYRRRAYKVSQVGVGTVEAVYEAVKRPSEDGSYVSSTLRWFGHNLIHDDLAAIEDWLQQVVLGSDKAKTASAILGSIEFPTEPVLSTLLDIIGSDLPFSAVQALLEAFARLSHIGRIPDHHWPRLLAAIRSLHPDSCVGFHYLPEGPDTIIVALVETSKEVIQGKIVRTAMAAVAQAKLEQLAITLVQARDGSDSELRTALTTIGANYYWGSYNYQRIAAAAQQIQNEPECLLVLLHWLIGALDSNGHQQDKHLLGDLLGLTVAAVELLPASFAAFERSDVLEQKLVGILQEGYGFVVGSGAITLLSRLRRISARTVRTILDSVHSDPYVQQTALNAALRMRVADDETLDAVIQELRHPSAARVYVAAQILRALARNSYTDPAQHTQIVGALGDAIKDISGSPRRDVYLMLGDWREVTGYFTIQFLARLEATLYDALVRISEIGSTPRSMVRKQDDRSSLPIYEFELPGVEHSQQTHIRIKLGDPRSTSAVAGFQINAHRLPIRLEPALATALKRVGQYAWEQNTSLAQLVACIVEQELSKESI